MRAYNSKVNTNSSQHQTPQILDKHLTGEFRPITSRKINHTYSPREFNVERPLQTLSMHVRKKQELESKDFENIRISGCSSKDLGILKFTRLVNNRENACILWISVRKSSLNSQCAFRNAILVLKPQGLSQVHL